MNRRISLLFAAGLILLASFLLDHPFAVFMTSHPANGTVRSVVRVMQWPGIFAFSLAALGLILLERRNIRWAIASVLTSAAAASLVTVVLKWATGRTRPLKGIDPFDLRPFLVSLGGQNLSFPSGHTTLAFATAASVWVLGSKARWLLVAWAACTAIARCTLAAHYPSDVVAAALIGGFCGIWCTRGCQYLVRLDGDQDSQALRSCSLLYLTLIIGPFAFALDRPVSQWISGRRPGVFEKLILETVQLPGNYLFTVALAAVCLIHARRHAAALLLVAGGSASLITLLIKWTFGRPRPYRHLDPFDWSFFSIADLANGQFPNPSFPSGDATLAFATALVLARQVPRCRRWAFVWAAAVCVARVLQGAHYPSDTVAGAAIGLGAAALVARRPIFNRPDDRRDSRQSVPDSEALPARKAEAELIAECRPPLSKR